MVQPIAWPSVTLGSGLKITFRLAYSAYYQLSRWGIEIDKATVIELAAAAAGEFDAAGKWRSAGFVRPIDFADMLEPGDEAAISEAVVDALKKVLPEAVLSVQPIPAATEAE